MAENASDGSGDNGTGKADSEAMKKNMSNNLPMVVAPKLGAGEEAEPVEETPDRTAADASEAAAPAAAQSSRFLMLAASVAFAAAFGSFVGSVSGSGLAHFLYPPAAPTGAAATTDAMRDTKLELAELSAIKTNLDTVSHSTTSQLSRLADRLERLDAHAAAETTGAIPAAPPSAPAAQPPKFTDRILQDWVVQDVQGGRALVESRYGGVFDVGEGSVLPGVGRVDQIKREDGQWLVLTARGTITSGR